MQYNTFSYILVFLPICLFLYYQLNMLNEKVGKIFLVAASLVFYSFGGAQGFWLLILSATINYLIVIGIRRKHSKGMLWNGLIFNIALLFYFKYFNFSIETVNNILEVRLNSTEIILPLGISFYTFQLIAYLIDTYRGETDQNSILDYLLYVTFFPKIIMGPIVKQSNLIQQFHDNEKQKWSPDNFTKGIQLFVVGLSKKVFLADTFGRAVTWVGGNFGQLSTIDLWLVVFAYTFQLYFDFSGYSDMATGTALMFNIEFSPNFNSPYMATSIRDFWKRWHISLTKWLTEYIYIPLGGNKKGIVATCINTMIVFLISGAWHGANWTFLIWGGVHGILSIFDRLTEKYWIKVPNIIRGITTFVLVSLLWLLFWSSSAKEWIESLRRMFIFGNVSVSRGLMDAFVLPEMQILNTMMPFPWLNGVTTGIPMIFFFLMAVIVCLMPYNSNTLKYKDSTLSAVITALLMVYLFTCFGREAVFIYNNF